MRLLDLVSEVYVEFARHSCICQLDCLEKVLVLFASKEQEQVVGVLRAELSLHNDCIIVVDIVKRDRDAGNFAVFGRLGKHNILFVGFTVPKILKHCWEIANNDTFVSLKHKAPFTFVHDNSSGHKWAVLITTIEGDPVDSDYLFKIFT